MAVTPHTTAHFSTNPLKLSSSLNKFPPKVNVLRCALSTPKLDEETKNSSSRRLVSISLLISHLLVVPNHAKAAGYFDKYVKRKKLDPLEAYVPAVILTQFQIKDLEKILEVDEPQFANYRSLLRSGPAASLRLNIRAVAQYASDAGSGDAAFNDVDQCLRALEDLDSLFLRASRNDRGASVESMRAKISVSLNALDSLLQTVPGDILQKGKAIADAYVSQEEEEEEAQPEILDPELKKLESIL
ncbi:uncharacterized protein LOC126670763 [Mercurialis annua]|uniref:uncharacterized protein LOC126670763 n=1 Tax=Mercurialis annua TaxID=3986 RepID=UPI00215F53DF|nr:uncharacterized protein LOC126670763 [Mercurialis annua]